MVDLLRALRPYQWTKNALVFAALVFAQELGDPGKVALATVAFVVFCLASSAIYIFNDIADRERDRHHPEKRDRPIAAGRVSVPLAATVATSLAAAALAGAWSVNERLAAVIAGYLVVNDVSARDWQLRVPTWTMGKSFDTHGPIGPWIATAEEIGDPHQLRLRTWINGELRQESSTEELIFDCFTLVEHLSTAFTLEPGDVISTGTPGGVGVGMKPPQLLQVGDVMRVEIEGIGQIENRVIEEPSDTAFKG